MSANTNQTGADPAPSDAMVASGPMHRLGLAVEDSHEAAAWFGRVFGAKPFGDSFVPWMADGVSVREEIRAQEGSDSRMLWHGGYPLLLLSPFGSGGYVERHLSRWGPGVHSLAWEIEDMWGADARLRGHGLSIAGVNIPGRHFFVHPRDTDGVMIEFTDTFWNDDPRRGAPAIAEDGGLIKGHPWRGSAASSRTQPPPRSCCPTWRARARWTATSVARRTWSARST